MASLVTIAPDAHTLMRYLRQIQTAGYTRLASNAIIFFDYMITLDREVILIWGSKWSSVKVLFLVNRYYGLFVAVFKTCSFFGRGFTDSLFVFTSNFLYQPNALIRLFNIIAAWTAYITSFLADCILQVRVYALYGQDSKILYLMLVSFAACFAASGAVMGRSLTGVSAFAIEIPRGQLCVAPRIADHFYSFWIPMMAFEGFLCVLALIRGFREYSFRGSMSSTRSLFDIVIRDSLMYFVAIGIVYVSCLVVWIVEPNFLTEAPTGFALAISSTMGCRMILNLRDANQQEENTYTSEHNVCPQFRKVTRQWS